MELSSGKHRYDFTCTTEKIHHTTIGVQHSFLETVCTYQINLLFFLPAESLVENKKYEHGLYIMSQISLYKLNSDEVGDVFQGILYLLGTFFICL